MNDQIDAQALAGSVSDPSFTPWVTQALESITALPDRAADVVGVAAMAFATLAIRAGHDPEALLGQIIEAAERSEFSYRLV